MFTTLAGPLPAAADDLDARVRLSATVTEQLTAGIGLVSEAGALVPDPFVLVASGLDGLEPGPIVPAPAGPGSVRAPLIRRLPVWSAPFSCDAWRQTAGEVGGRDAIVKQVLPGPVTLGRLAVGDDIDRPALTRAFAEALNAELRALVAAGCPFVQVDEPAAAWIDDLPTERALWRDAQARLTDGIDAGHLCLAVLGGSAESAGAETLFEAPYASFLFDLIDGPDNWRLITRMPAERGIVVGALDTRPGQREVKETLVWAVQYAASTRLRGTRQVGLATAGSMAGCTWQEARARLAVLHEAATIASSEDPDEVRRALDPRAVDIRSAALGRYDPTARAPRTRPARDRDQELDHP